MGAKPFLLSIGVDYDLFEKLYKADYSAHQIGKAFINKRTGKHYSAGAVKPWIAVYEEEHPKP
jgi:hypothetical protein